MRRKIRLVSLRTSLLAALAALALILSLGQAVRAQADDLSPSPAVDPNARLAKLEQQAADAKSSGDNAWMLTAPRWS